MSLATLKTMEELVKVIPKILQFDRLEKLSKRHPILAMSYSALIDQINSIIIATGVSKVGGVTVGPITFAEEEFGPSWDQKLQAISFAFKIESSRIHDLMSVETISALAEGIGFDLSDMLDSMSKLIIALGKESIRKLPSAEELAKAAVVAA